MSKSVPLSEIINKKNEEKSESNIINDILNDVSDEQNKIVDEQKKEQHIMEQELQKTIDNQKQQEEQILQQEIEQNSDEQDYAEDAQEGYTEDAQEGYTEDAQEGYTEDSENALPDKLDNGKSEIRLSGSGNKESTSDEKNFSMLDKLMLYIKYFLVIFVTTSLVSLPFVEKMITGLVEKREFLKKGISCIVPMLKGFIVGLVFVLCNIVI